MAGECSPSSAFAEFDIGRDFSGGRSRAAISRSSSSVPGTLCVTGPSTETYRIVGATRSTIGRETPGCVDRRAFHDPAEVGTHASPPGSY